MVYLHIGYHPYPLHFEVTPLLVVMKIVWQSSIMGLSTVSCLFMTLEAELELESKIPF